MKAIKELYECFLSHPSVSTDTRKIEPGSLFFALKGPNHDGNAFATEAIEKGAAFAVVSDPALQGDQFFFVEDTLKSLQDLATYHRSQFRIPVLGITGSNGKTTTKGLLKSVLQEKYRTHATYGNLNNHIGVPLTLLDMPLDTEFAIIEMGANHVGEIAELCRIALPDAGLITCIGEAHLEGFGGIEGVFRGKSELFNHVRSVYGTFFLNGEDPYLSRLQDHSLNMITYGHHPEFQVCTTRAEGGPGISFMYHGEGQQYQFESRLYGDYNLINITAALAVGLHYKVPIRDIQAGVRNFQSIENRSQLLQFGGKTVVLDAYNANPSSMRSAIDAFGSNFGKGALILGDMKELGQGSRLQHQALVDQISSEGWPEVILVGEEFGKTIMPERFRWYPDRASLNEKENIGSIDHAYILIKGSRSMRLEEFLDQENN